MALANVFDEVVQETPSTKNLAFAWAVGNHTGLVNNKKSVLVFVWTQGKTRQTAITFWHVNMPVNGACGFARSLAQNLASSACWC